MRKVILTLAVMATAGTVEAGPFRRRAVYQSQASCTVRADGSSSCKVVESYRGPEGTFATTTTATTPATGGDALGEVNALRAARGLPPYLPDPNLTAGAMAAAQARAARGLFGHTANDFQFLPPGTSAAAAGCAAYHDSYGWMSCAVYDRYRYAGAAWVRGADGRRFMHLFVR